MAIDERIWEAANPEPLIAEEGVPAEYPQWGFLSISTFQHWSDVVNWALPFYDRPATSADTLAAVDKIKRDSTDRNARITAPYASCKTTFAMSATKSASEDSIPRTPREVLALGYGDCKDKSVLLTAILRQLGVEASPPSRVSRTSAASPISRPSPFDFDHVVVGITDAGKTYWIDATTRKPGRRVPKYRTTPISGWFCRSSRATTP